MGGSAACHPLMTLFCGRSTSVRAANFFSPTTSLRVIIQLGGLGFRVKFSLGVRVSGMIRVRVDVGVRVSNLLGSV